MSAHEILDNLLGLRQSSGDLSWSQIGLRTAVVFIFGVFLIRMADRRFLGRNAGFDVLLVIVLGSVLSRAINGQAPFFKTLGASVLLVLLHRLFGEITCRFPTVSKMVKGDAIVLVKQGKALPKAMRLCHISEDDLEENLRLNANVAGIEEVAEARLERNGQISVVKSGKPNQPTKLI